MGFRNNTTNRLSSNKTLNLVEIFELDNFPAPSGGITTLPDGKYLFKSPTIDLSTRKFDVPANGNVVFEGDIELTMLLPLLLQVILLPWEPGLILLLRN